MKLSSLIWLCAICACTAPAFAQAVNDDCTGALPIFCGDLVVDDTSLATPEIMPFCGTGDGTGGGVWYTFAGTGDQVTLTTCNATTAYDTKIRVYEGACGALVCVAGNDDNCAAFFLRTTVAFLSVPGVDYSILVHGFAAGQGLFEMTVACVSPVTEVCGDGIDNDLDGLIDCADPDCAADPACDESLNCADGLDNDFDGYLDCGDADCFGDAGCIAAGNDNCTGALPVVCGDIVVEDTSLSTPDGVPTCVTTNGTGGGLWYTFAGNGDQVTLTTCNATTAYDTKIRVYEGTCGALICVAGNDDNCAAFIFRTTVSFLTIPGVDYSILVHGFGAGQGLFEMSVSCLTPGVEVCDDGVDNDLDGDIDCADADCSAVPACFPPPNDDCANATVATLGTVTGNVSAASPDGASTCGASTGNPDTWYSFTAPSAGTYLFSTCGTHDAPGLDLGMDTVLNLFDVCGGIELGCDDDAGPPPCGGSDTGILRDSVVSRAMAAGESVVVRISHFGGVIANGDYTFTIGQDCGNIDPVTCGYDCATDVMTLSWTDNALATAGYDILENGVVIGSVPAGIASFSFVGPAAGNNTYTVNWACALGGPGLSGGCTFNVQPPLVIPAGTTDLILNQESLPVALGGGLILSGPALELALNNNGRTTFMVGVENFDAAYNSGCFAMDQVQTIWVLTGTFNSDYRITAGEGGALAALNALGVGVYFEGGDHWGFVHQVSAFDDRDGVNAVGNADGNDLFVSMNAVAGALVDLSVPFPGPQPYTQDQAGNDWTDQLQTAAGTDLDVTLEQGVWVDTTAGYITAVYAEHAAGANTLVQSWEFGGFAAANRDALAAEYLALLGRVGGGCPSPGPSQFVRGDGNQDGLFNIADPVFTLSFLFPVGAPPNVNCFDALDANDDGLLNIADPVYDLSVLFPTMAPPPAMPAPFPNCGCDPTVDAIDCLSFNGCP